MNHVIFRFNYIAIQTVKTRSFTINFKRYYEKGTLFVFYRIAVFLRAGYGAAGEHRLPYADRADQPGSTRAWQITKYDLSENREQGRGCAQVTKCSQRQRRWGAKIKQHSGQQEIGQRRQQ